MGRCRFNADSIVPARTTRGSGLPGSPGLGGSDSAGCSSGEAGAGEPSQGARHRLHVPGILTTSSTPNFLLLLSLEVQ